MFSKILLISLKVPQNDQTKNDNTNLFSEAILRNTVALEFRIYQKQGFEEA